MGKSGSPSGFFNEARTINPGVFALPEVLAGFMFILVYLPPFFAVGEF